MTAGKIYEYRVTAVNEGGESDPSDPSDGIKAKPLKGKCIIQLCWTSYEDFSGT